jgi:Fibronectin type III domain
VTYWYQQKVCPSPLILMCLLIGLDLVSSAPRLSAAESAQRHSLIHRQESDSRPVEPKAVAPASPSPSPSTARSLHRRLTKRPGQGVVTSPSAGFTQSTPSPSQPPSAVPTPSDSRLSTGVSALALQAPFTTSALSGTSVPPAGVTTARPGAASALASAANGAAVSSGSSVTGGRGLQRLVGQMPSLSQLLTPTLSVTTPTSSSPSPSPPSPSPSSPSSSSPPPTSPAPPPSTGSALLSWTINSESDLAGYKIYVGTTPGQYTYPGSPIIIGRVSSYTVSGLPASQTYYFAISAFNYSGSESGLSAEVSKSIY